MGGDSLEDELALYLDVDEGSFGDIAEVPADFYIEVCAILRRYSDDIFRFLLFDQICSTREWQRVIRLALQNLNAKAECNSAVAVNAEALERVCLAEYTAASLLASWILEKVSKVSRHN